MTLKRLDRLLSDSGSYSRSEARTVIQAGAVTVDGAVERRPEAKFPCGCRVIAEGREVDTEEFVYLMMNKPPDTVSATEDELYPAVTRLLPPPLQKRGVFPVGRLDADVTGLLILTDNGPYAHRVTSPRSNTEKCYEARLDGPVTAADAESLAHETVFPDGTVYRPARLVIDEADACLARIWVTEGKFHEVKNLFRSRGRQVLQLRRLSIGNLALDGDMPRGGWRRMTPEEAEKALN